MSQFFERLVIGLSMFAVVLGWALFKWYFSYRAQARRDIRAIVRGLRAYVKRYGRLPTVTDDEDEQDAAKLLEVLCGAKWEVGKTYYPVSAAVAELNPDGINFVPDLMGKLTINDALADPWGNPYRIALGRMEDGTTEIKCQDDQTFSRIEPRLEVRTLSERYVTVLVKSPCAVWSSGPNRKNECGYGDDICSWK